jgi:homoserine dehydrogenase
MTTDEKELTSLDKIELINEKISLYSRIVTLEQEDMNTFVELTGVDVSNSDEYNQFIQEIEDKKQALTQAKNSLENQG